MLAFNKPHYFVLSFDRINRTINFRFSFDLEGLAPIEQEAVDIILDRFAEMSSDFLQRPSDSRALKGMAYVTRDILKEAYEYTGVEILLDDSGLGVLH